MQQHVHIQTTIDHTNDVERDRYDHERMHRTIDELIEQAAVKTRSAVCRIFYFEIFIHNILRLKKFDYNTMRIWNESCKNITIWKRY